MIRLVREQADTPCQATGFVNSIGNGQVTVTVQAQSSIAAEGCRQFQTKHPMDQLPPETSINDRVCVQFSCSKGSPNVERISPDPCSEEGCQGEVSEEANNPCMKAFEAEVDKLRARYTETLRAQCPESVAEDALSAFEVDFPSRLASGRDNAQRCCEERGPDTTHPQCTRQAKQVVEPIRHRAQHCVTPHRCNNLAGQINAINQAAERLLNQDTLDCEQFAHLACGDGMSGVEAPALDLAAFACNSVYGIPEPETCQCDLIKRELHEFFSLMEQAEQRDCPVGGLCD